MYFLLSRTQAGPGRTVKQEQEEISRNHVQTFSGCSVQPKDEWEEESARVQYGWKVEIAIMRTAAEDQMDDTGGTS